MPPSDAPRSGTVELRADLGAQIDLMGTRSPPCRRVLEALDALLPAPEGAAIAARLGRAWRARTFDAFYDRPLLLLAALRFDALTDGPAHPLHAALRDDAPDPAAATREALLAALAPGRLGVWTSLATRRVQTNETARAVAWMWPATLAGCAGGGRPLALLDVGCSAGLNLVADALDRPWTDARGAPLGVSARFDVVSRAGIDARPVDASAPDAVRWLRACVWPGEAARLARLDAAVHAFERARRAPRPPAIERDDVGSAASRLALAQKSHPPRTLALAYQTLVTGYLAAAARREYEAAMRAWLASARAASALWVELELDPAATDPNRPAVLRAHAGDGRGGVATRVIARAGYHPSSLAVDERAARELAALLDVK